jgi:hypothetical protein
MGMPDQNNRPAPVNMTTPREKCNSLTGGGRSANKLVLDQSNKPHPLTPAGYARNLETRTMPDPVILDSNNSKGGI